MTFQDAFTHTVELAFDLPVIFVVAVLTTGLLGAVLSATVTVLIELVFPSLSVAVTDKTLLAFYFFFIVTVNFPELLDFALPSAVLHILTVTVEPASAFPVTFVVMSPTPFTVGFAGAVLSSTTLDFDNHQISSIYLYLGSKKSSISAGYSKVPIT
ncbi:hypothetical protein ABEY41_00250 [Peribacillus butanolivorans]|uniref:hypothetical protein n=1 Tax=Peribacillus butanolivorans TaxID=421767 RepID=UPI003D2B2701